MLKMPEVLSARHIHMRNFSLPPLLCAQGEKTRVRARFRNGLLSNTLSPQLGRVTTILAIELFHQKFGGFVWHC